MRIPAALIGAVLLTFSGASGGGLGDLFKSAEDALSGSGLAGGRGVGGELSDAQIGSGLKQALSIGAERAVSTLATRGGFLQDDRVRIPLPGPLRQAGGALRAVGYGDLVDEFEVTVNRAAERAMPETLEIVKQTVRDMTLTDVRRILNGGDTAATEYLREHAGERLHRAVRPIVAEATESAGATAAYKNLQGRMSAGVGGLLGGGSLDLDDYVTGKALDGLFLKLAAEEKAIRENPVARTTDLLKQVFGGR